MIINFSPQRRDDDLAIIKTDDILNIDGTDYDFSDIPEGGTLPADAVDCEFIIGDVERVNGELQLTIILPHTSNASEEQRFPEPLTVNTDGQVVLPE